MELNISIPDNEIVFAVDSTGMKVTSRGDWMREKHGVERKGWIKVHIAVDVETRRPITFEITDERVTDLLNSKNMVMIAGEKCINMAGGGRQRASFRQSSAYLARL